MSTRAAQIAILHAEILAREQQIVALVEDGELVARAAVEAELAALGRAPAPPPARPRKPRRRRAGSAAHPSTSAADVDDARAAARRAGMLPR